MVTNPVTNNLKQTNARFYLPVSKLGVGGWKDYDEPVLKRDLPLEDKVAYLRFRLGMVIFDPLDNVFLRSAKHHKAVNGPAMSFFFIGTTIICCCIESLGGFVSAIRGGGAGENKQRFRAFVDKYLTLWAVTTPKGVNVTDWLWKNIRNRLAHTLLIENGGLEDLGADRFRDKGNGKLEVHAEILYTDFKLGIEQYFSDVIKKPSETLAKNFESHFKNEFQTF